MGDAMNLEDAIKEAESARESNEALRAALHLRNVENQFLRELLAQLQAELLKWKLDPTYEPGSPFSDFALH